MNGNFQAKCVLIWTPRSICGNFDSVRTTVGIAFVRIVLLSESDRLPVMKKLKVLTDCSFLSIDLNLEKPKIITNTLPVKTADFPTSLHAFSLFERTLDKDNDFL